MRRNTFIVYVLMWFSTAALAQNTHWELFAEEDGVKLFRSTNDDSAIVSFKGEASLSASPEQILSILKDNESASEWLPLVEKREVHQSLADEGRVEITYVDMPFFFTDRYFVNQTQLTRAANRQLIITTQSVNDHSIDIAGRVLGFLHHSYIDLRPTNAGQTLATVEIHSDPKGLIPKWLVNLGQKKWPLEFFLGLRRMIIKQQNIAH